MSPACAGSAESTGEAGFFQVQLVLCAASGRLADLAVGVHAGELVVLGGEQAVAQPQVLSS